MNKIILIMVSLLLCSLGLADCGVSCGGYYSFEPYFHPYVGAGVQVRYMDYRRDYGSNMFRHNLPQGNIYAGIKLNESFALEMGYEKSILRRRVSILSDGQLVNRTPILGKMDPVTFRNGKPIVNRSPVLEKMDPVLLAGSMKIGGPYLDLVRLSSLSQDNRLNLLSAVGLSFLKGKSIRQVLCDNQDSYCSIRFMEEEKLVLRLSLGIQHMITNELGARGIIVWQNTSKMRFAQSDEKCAIYSPKVNPKDSIVYSLGLLWEF